MKKIIIITLLLNFIVSIASAAEKKDCSVHKKLIDKMKCKTANAVKPKGFFKKTIDKTIDYQKKAFDKKD